MSEKLVLSVEEMSQTLGISRHVAYQLTRSEGFPVIKVGRRTLISKEALRKWLEVQTQKNPA